MMGEINSIYDWKITAKKFAISLVETIIAAVISYYANSPAPLGLIPVAEAIRNWIKNRKN